MSRRRYRKRQEDGGSFEELLIAVFYQPLVGVVLSVLLLVVAGFCYANSSAMFGTMRLFGLIALLVAVLAVMFTLAGVIVRWLKRPPTAAHRISAPKHFPTWNNTLPPPLPGTRLPIPVQNQRAREASMLSKGEMAFYDPLRDIVSGRYEIHLKAGMADILGCRDHPQFREIAAMHVDFLLCDPQTLQPLLAIELDDRSHARSDRMNVDRWKEQLLAEKRIPLLRQNYQAAYDVLSVKDAIERAIEQGRRR